MTMGRGRRSGRVPASALVREYLGFVTMEAPGAARRFLEGFVERWPFTEAARKLFEGIHFEVADLSQELGGGFWHPDRRTVQVRGSQAEALIHELAHAWWEEARKRPGAIESLVEDLQRLAEERDPRYERAATLAGHYVHGIKSQPDPDSPTGYWRGMRQTDGSWIDWEIFAGLASGTMGDLALLPGYMRRHFADLFEARKV
jgi:hypothetical protein